MRANSKRDVDKSMKLGLWSTDEHSRLASALSSAKVMLFFLTQETASFNGYCTATSTLRPASRDFSPNHSEFTVSWNAKCVPLSSID